MQKLVRPAVKNLVHHVYDDSATPKTESLSISCLSCVIYHLCKGQHDVTQCTTIFSLCGTPFDFMALPGVHEKVSKFPGINWKLCSLTMLQLTTIDAIDGFRKVAANSVIAS